MSQPNMIRRQAATTATLNKYRAKPFDWSKGCTCVHLARFHLRQMGHRPPTIPRVRSLLAAKRALKERGWSDTAAMLDSLLPRIPPASMLLGDLAILEDDSGLGAIVVSAGGKCLGWHENAPGMVVLQPLEITAAWRV